MKSPPYLVLVVHLISIRASMQYKQEYNTKRVIHSRVCPMLYAMSYVHLSSNHNNRTKYSTMKLKFDTCLNVNV